MIINFIVGKALKAIGNKNNFTIDLVELISSQTGKSRGEVKRLWRQGGIKMTIINTMGLKGKFSDVEVGYQE